MVPNVACYLNKTVFVSVPPLFEDESCRPFTLVGAELHGLWLQSGELTRGWLAEDTRDLTAAVFARSPRLAGVLVAGGSLQSLDQEWKGALQYCGGHQTRMKSPQ